FWLHNNKGRLTRGCNPTSSKFIHTWLRFGEIMRGSLSTLPLVQRTVGHEISRTGQTQVYIHEFNVAALLPVIDGIDWLKCEMLHVCHFVLYLNTTSVFIAFLRKT